MRTDFLYDGFKEKLFKQKRFVFVGGPEKSDTANVEDKDIADKATEAKVPTPEEQAKEKAQKTEKTLNGFRKNLTGLVKNKSILSDEALRTVIVDAMGKLDEKIRKVLSDGVTEDEFSQLESFVGDRVEKITGIRPTTETIENEEEGAEETEKNEEEEKTPEGSNHLRSLIDEFNKGKDDKKNDTVQAFINKLGTDNMDWLKNNEDKIDQAQFSKSIEGLFDKETDTGAAETLADTIRPQIDTARSVAQRTPELATKQALETRQSELGVSRVRVKEGASKYTTEDFEKKYGKLLAPIMQIFHRFGWVKLPPKEVKVKPKEKISETNNRKLAVLSKKYQTLKGHFDDELPLNFNQMFESAGKDLNGGKGRPLEEMLITEENISFLTESEDDALVKEFLDARSEKFTKIMDEILKDIDEKNSPAEDDQSKASKKAEGEKKSDDGKEEAKKARKSAVENLFKKVPETETPYLNPNFLKSLNGLDLKGTPLRGITFKEGWYVKKDDDNNIYLVDLAHPDKKARVFKIGLGEKSELNIALLKDDDMKAEFKKFGNFNDKEYNLKNITNSYKGKFDVYSWENVKDKTKYDNDDLDFDDGVDSRVFLLWNKRVSSSGYGLEGYVVVQPSGIARVYDYDPHTSDDFVGSYFLPIGKGGEWNA